MRAGDATSGLINGGSMDPMMVRPSRHHGIHIFNVCMRALINIHRMHQNFHLTWSELAEAMTFIKGGPDDPAFPFVSELIVCLPHASDETNLSWASILRIHRPVLSSQMRIVWSSAAERRYLPFGWKTRDRTQSS